MNTDEEDLMRGEGRGEGRGGSSFACAWLADASFWLRRTTRQGDAKKAKCGGGVGDCEFKNKN